VQLPFSLNDDTEFDSEALVALVIEAAIRSVQAATLARPDLEVTLVGVSVFAVTIICLDTDMKPLWNACSYADKRTFEFAETARSQMDAEQLRLL
jgi:sugar (pentulose or hexulose) kinase